MQALENSHPILQNLETEVKKFNPHMYFQKQMGLVLPKGIFLRGFVGAEDLTTIRTADGQVLNQTKFYVPLVDLSLDTGKIPPLQLSPNRDAIRYMEHIAKLIRHLSDHTQALIEGRPI